MPWVQNYDPFGWWQLSTLAAALSPVALLGALASGKVNAVGAAVLGLLVSLATATLAFGMPVRPALAAAAMGLNFAAFQIIWLVVSAVFLYQIVVDTGRFEIMKASIARLSSDRRIQAILIAFSFGAFIEGAAGFGAPVAISAAFLVGLGFDAFMAALLCLIANTAPVAWGAIGTPIRTLAAVTKFDVELLSAITGRILPPLSLVIPAWLVVVMAGAKGAWEVWPALAVVGGTFAVAQFVWSNYVGFELVDIVASIASLAGGIVLLRFWKPRSLWRFPGESEEHHARFASISLSRRAVFGAWAPFGLLTLTVLAWGAPPVAKGGLGAKAFLDKHTSWNVAMPWLDRAVAKGAAAGGPESPSKANAEEARLVFNPISSTGTAVFLAAIAGGACLGLSPRRMAAIFVVTLRRLAPAMLAIAAMLALGFVTRYSGMDAVLGLAFTRVGGGLYPIFGALLGWLGVALTGSDTSSNVLFGNLQVVTARALGLNPALMASANSAGGVMGKMIDAQSIVVAAAATGEQGREGELLRKVLLHSLILAVAVGAIVFIYAHVAPGLIAVPPR